LPRFSGRKDQHHPNAGSQTNLFLRPREPYDDISIVGYADGQILWPKGYEFRRFFIHMNTICSVIANRRFLMSCFVLEPLATRTSHRHAGALSIINAQLGTGVHSEIEFA
jgi:hypothetical protein